MKALSLDDHDRLVAVCNLKIPLMSLMLSLIKKKYKKIQNDVLSVLQVWEGGPLWFFFLFLRAGAGLSMLEFCGERGLI